MEKTKKISLKEKNQLLRNNVMDALAASFADIKEVVGDKKFNEKIRKASKVLTAGVEKKKAKTAAIKEKEAAVSNIESE